MRSQLKFQAKVIPNTVPDPTGAMDKISLYNTDGTPFGGVHDPLIGTWTIGVDEGWEFADPLWYDYGWLYSGGTDDSKRMQVIVTRDQVLFKGHLGYKGDLKDPDSIPYIFKFPVELFTSSSLCELFCYLYMEDITYFGPMDCYGFHRDVDDSGSFALDDSSGAWIDSDEDVVVTYGSIVGPSLSASGTLGPMLRDGRTL